MNQPDTQEIRIRPPGWTLSVTYASQEERDRTLALAEARQAIAHEGNHNPTWQELTDEERGTSEVASLHWLRAAERAGLLAAAPEPSAAPAAPAGLSLTVQALITQLAALPQHAGVVLSADIDGNAYAPLDTLTTGHYLPHSACAGDFHADHEPVPRTGTVPAVCLFPAD